MLALLLTACAPSPVTGESEDVDTEVMEFQRDLSESVACTDTSVHAFTVDESIGLSFQRFSLLDDAAGAEMTQEYSLSGTQAYLWLDAGNSLPDLWCTADPSDRVEIDRTWGGEKGTVRAHVVPTGLDDVVATVQLTIDGAELYSEQEGTFVIDHLELPPIDVYDGWE